MLYHQEFLKINKECPFCEPKKVEGIIKENDHAFMTYAIAPYHKHHILVLTKRHISNFDDLSNDETLAVNKLMKIGVKMLRTLGYNNYNILIRNGEKVLKTVDHLHYHIIPDAILGDLEHNNDNRSVMSKEEIIEILKDFENLKIEE